MDTSIGALSHFAVNADDLPATRTFYERVFGWSFTPWGPPEFFHVHPRPGADPIGALQHRRDLGVPVGGFECTVSVGDVHAAMAAALAAGGEVLMQPAVISGVGELVFLRDPSGNVVGAMRYDAAAD